MIKKIGLAAVLSTLLFTGCGGGSSNTTASDSASIEEIEAKDAIFIYKNLTDGIDCSNAFDTLTQAQLDQAKVENLITQEVDSTTTCETYGKINEDGVCLEHDFEIGNTTCLIAYDIQE